MPRDADVPPQDVTVEWVDSVPVVRVHGDLDIVNATTLEATLAKISTPGVFLVVDMSGVGFCGAAGLGPLLEHQSRLQDSAGRLVIADCRPDVLNLFTLAGVARLLTIRDSVADAIRDRLEHRSEGG